jgi:hypothetical protein
MTWSGLPDKAKSFVLSFYSFVGVYVILYSPQLKLSGTGLVKPLALCGLAVGTLHACIRGKFTIKSSKEIILLLVYGLCVFSLQQLIALFGGGDILALNLLVSFSTGILPLCYFIVRAFPCNESAFTYLVRLTAVTGAIQSIFILLDWFSPLAREVFSAIIMQPPGILVTFRAAGLTSMTGDGLSFSQALCGICAFYLSLNSSRLRSRIFWICCFSLVFISMIFVGRTGFVMMSVFILFISFFSENRLRAFYSFGTFLIVATLLILVPVYFLESERLTFIVNTILPHAFESFYSYIEGTGFRTLTTDALKTDMLVFPVNNLTWLFGDGYYADTLFSKGNYMGTDIGYLRVLFYVGIVGSLALYLWYLLAAYIVSRAIHNAEDKLLCAGVFICFFVAHVKFPFFFSGVVLGYVCLMLFSSYKDRTLCV